MTNSSSWQPIDTAPEGALVVVGWRVDGDGPESERHDFDWKEDGCWRNHADNHEHYVMVGGPSLGPGPSEQAPYTHWLRLESLPTRDSQPRPTPGDLSKPALPAEPYPASKALEFAEYMAKGAEQLINAINAEDALRLRREESDDVAEDVIYDASASRSEFVRGLRDDIYEFRKRRDKVAAGEAQVPWPVITIEPCRLCVSKEGGGFSCTGKCENATTLKAAYQSHGIRCFEMKITSAREPAQRAWPKSRDVGRVGDMAPADRTHMRVLFDSDNDVIVEVWQHDENEEFGRHNSIEFCNGGGGGGASPKTRMALIALMVAMEADNAENPRKQYPPAASFIPHDTP